MSLNFLSSLTPMQGAAVIAAHSLFTKVLITVGLRLSQFLEKDRKKVKELESNIYTEPICRAQLNAVEYSGLLVAILLAIATAASSAGGEDDTGESSTTLATHGTSLAVLGQVGYFYSSVFFGYPAFTTAGFASLRNAGGFALAYALCKIAF